MPTMSKRFQSTSSSCAAAYESLPPKTDRPTAAARAVNSDRRRIICSGSKFPAIRLRIRSCASSPGTMPGTNSQNSHPTLRSARAPWRRSRSRCRPVSARWSRISGAGRSPRVGWSQMCRPSSAASVAVALWRSTPSPATSIEVAGMSFLMARRSLRIRAVLHPVPGFRPRRSCSRSLDASAPCRSRSRSRCGARPVGRSWPLRRGRRRGAVRWPPRPRSLPPRPGTSPD